MKKQRGKNERGAVLVTAILVVAVLGVLALGVTLATNSDMLINGYYRNYGGSFYAADSGVTIARQQLIDQTLAAVPATFASGTPPLPAGTAATVQTYLTTTYANYTSLNTGNASQSWPSSFKITTATFALITAPAQPVVTSTDASGVATGYQYTFTYALTAMGQSRGGEQATVTDSGNIILNAALSPAASATQSFAAWGMFIDQYSACNGSYLVPGTISGPVFTNGAWTFGSSGAYIFTDTVGSVSATEGYYNLTTGSCTPLAASSYSSGGVSIRPTFQNGLQMNQHSIPLPANSFSQQRAVLDGLGTNTAAPTKAELNAALRDVNGTSYPIGGATTGVFAPYQTVAGVATMDGGGIYVEGDAQITLSTIGAKGEVYTIKQGSVTTVITIDPVANTTKIVSGGVTKNLSGVPQNLITTPQADTMLYVHGNITGLSGPGEGTAAINDGTGLTITGSGSITITGDILYKTEPVTLTQNLSTGTPADTLIPGNDKGQTFGIFTPSGNINLANSQSSGNLEIDASIAAISAGGSGGLTNTGAAINTLTIVGGRIQNQIMSIGATTRNVFFDRRNSTGFGPPWFPSTSITPSGISQATITPTVQRVQWFNTIQ